MRFDPKIFNSSDSDSDSLPEEIDFPQDLEALADQLRDDAQYLAQRHPAILAKSQQEFSSKITAAVSLTGSSRSSLPFAKYSHRLLFAVAASVALFMVSWGNHSQPQQEDIAGQQIVEQFPPDIYGGILPGHILVAPLSESYFNVSESSVTRQPLYSDDLFLRKFSDPQFEGFLDLLDHQKVKIHPVSF